VKKVGFLTFWCLALWSSLLHNQETDQIEKLCQQGLQQIQPKEWESAQKIFEKIIFIDVSHAKSYF
jgi:outer membrane protein assembly factor BamD (BamD/ComL family)